MTKTLIFKDHDNNNAGTETPLVIQSLLNKYNPALRLGGALPLIDMKFYNQYGKSQGKEKLTRCFLDGYKAQYGIDLAAHLDQQDNEIFVHEITRMAYLNREGEVIAAVKKAADEKSDEQIVRMDHLKESILSLRRHPAYEVAISCSNALPRVLAQIEYSTDSTGQSTNGESYTNWVLQGNIFCPSTHGPVLYIGSDKPQIRTKGPENGDHYSFMIRNAVTAGALTQYTLGGVDFSRTAQLEEFRPERVIAIEDTGKKGYGAFLKGAVAESFVPNFILNVSFQKNKQQQIDDAFQARKDFLQDYLKQTGDDISKYVPEPLVMDGSDYSALPALIEQIERTAKHNRIPKRNGGVQALVLA